MGKRTAGTVCADETEAVIEIGDRLAIAYQLREMKMQRVKYVSDSAIDEWFDEVQTAPYPLRNDFTDKAQSLIQILKENGLDCLPLAKAVQAANHYVTWYAKEWFDCKAYLQSITRKPSVSKTENQTAFSDQASKRKRTRRQKGSKALTDAQEKIAAALRKWHRYNNGRCEDTTKLTIRMLQKEADVPSVSTVHDFFKDQAVGLSRAVYERLCDEGDNVGLGLALAKLSKEGMEYMLEAYVQVSADRSPTNDDE